MRTDSGIQPLDPALGIDWRLPAADILLSQKDLSRVRLADSDLPSFAGLYSHSGLDPESQA